jgi:hypothetical protein
VPAKVGVANNRSIVREMSPTILQKWGGAILQHISGSRFTKYTYFNA